MTGWFKRRNAVHDDPEGIAYPLTLWRRTASPSLRQMEVLRDALRASLTIDEIYGITPDLLHGLDDVLIKGHEVSIFFRRNKVALPLDGGDCVMGLLLLAAGEGDLIGRLGLVTALTRCASEGDLVAAEVALEQMSRAFRSDVPFHGYGFEALVENIAQGPYGPHEKAHFCSRTFLSAYLALNEEGFPERIGELLEPFGSWIKDETTERQGGKEPPVNSPGGSPTVPIEPGTMDGPTLRVIGNPLPKHAAHYAHLQSPIPLIRNPDPASFRSALLETSPWMRPVIDDLAEQLAIRSLGTNSSFRLRPFVLHGPPGTGKTTFARRMASAAGVPLWRFNAAGKSGAIELVGHSSTYHKAHASLPVQAIANLKVANPIVLVDEFDKFGGSNYNGDPLNALVAMLERETSVAFPDDFLGMPVDCSQITFIFTANRIDGLPAPLVDRLAFHEVPRIEPGHFTLAMECLLGDIASEHDIKVSDLPVMDREILADLRRKFAKTGSLRGLKSGLAAAIGRSLGKPPETRAAPEGNVTPFRPDKA